MAVERVSPFVFVAATRYAIWRTLTCASEEIAGQVLAHADLIRTDRGAVSAIIAEVAAATPYERVGGQTAGERRRIERAWQRAVEALEGRC